MAIERGIVQLLGRRIFRLLSVLAGLCRTACKALARRFIKAGNDRREGFPGGSPQHRRRAANRSLDAPIGNVQMIDDKAMPRG